MAPFFVLTVPSPGLQEQRSSEVHCYCSEGSHTLHWSPPTLESSNSFFHYAIWQWGIKAWGGFGSAFGRNVNTRFCAKVWSLVKSMCCLPDVDKQLWCEKQTSLLLPPPPRTSSVHPVVKRGRGHSIAQEPSVGFCTSYFCVIFKR